MGKPEDKYFRNHLELIDLMRSRHIDITDEENAAYILKNIPYYNLINNHKETFSMMDEHRNCNDDYNNTNFDDIRRVYDFEKEISSILYRYISIIEETLKSMIPHSISDEYGYLQKDYLEEENYKKGDIKNDGNGNHYSDRDKLLRKLNEKHELAYNPSIKHYKTEYQNVPPWILVNDCTFGELVNWLKLSNDKVKNNVIYHCLDESKKDKLDVPSYFFACLYNINEYRNIVSHGGRIFHHKCKHTQSCGLMKKYLDSYSIKMNNEAVGKDGFLSIVFSLISVFSSRDVIRRNFIEDILECFSEFKIDSEELYTLLLVRCDIKEVFLLRLKEFI
ncbi:Abi family protein [Vagococcus fluvialis]|uniref:Abi family protein n=1 Tax=Vagococcus fluvialis TaxID=2738 RepID=UPI001D09F00A|nr:Abi family protein [Vagococcus fluvialis]UDM70307.1 Abi family protein [Vagococcus fluvialis]UDM77725.1 Abi family protein [Vagococcus fluvialis]UDM81996.1 Abi family protein [Vagococcus fluvialis]